MHRDQIKELENELERVQGTLSSILLMYKDYKDRKEEIENSLKSLRDVQEIMDTVKKV